VQDAKTVRNSAHRIRAVHDEVHDNLLQLNSVAQRLWQRRRQLRLDDHAPTAQRTHRQFNDVSYGVIDVEFDVVGLGMLEERPNGPITSLAR
jgi:hypothetical protein